MAIDKDVLDQLLAGRDPDEVFARGGLLDDLKKALSERILNAELDEHLVGEAVPGRPNRKRRRLAQDGADGDVEGAPGRGLATGRAPSSRSSSPSTSGASPTSTTRSSRCTREG